MSPTRVVPGSDGEWLQASNGIDAWPLGQPREISYADALSFAASRTIESAVGDLVRFADGSEVRFIVEDAHWQQRYCETCDSELGEVLMPARVKVIVTEPIRVRSS
jgi:hypothetical protein